ncbi:MAG: hypothetical protein LJE84_11770 [Gammaproteobacteria bacterium]|nr:hypothetical protein [Gammaproteobacteria bacterium]
MQSNKLVFLFTAALAACATPADRLYQSGATRIELTRAVTFPVGETQRAIQDGKLVTREELYEARPYCVLRLGTIPSTEFTLRPGQFRVLRLFYREEQFASFTPVRVASGGGGGDGAGDRPYYFQTVFRTESTEQPELYSITCQQQSDYHLGEHLSMAEFRTAAGTLLRLGSG